MPKNPKPRKSTIRNLKGGRPPLSEPKNYRFLIARDAAIALNKDEGNFSKDIKAGKVKTEEMQLYVKGETEFYPLGTKTIQAVDMSQFKQSPE
jgi:hypothetical protein